MNTKRNTPQRRRRRAKESELERLRVEVLDRDNHSCVLCGAYADQVSHILSRGAHINLLLDIRNLAAICGECHNEHANTEEMVRQQFEKRDALLAKKNVFYDYSDWKKEEQYFVRREK